jgi:CBS domain containing-hemolysin-like protein
MDDPLSQIQFYAPGFSAIICLVASLFLLLMSAFASGSEIAFFSLTPKDLSELDSDNVKDRKILMLRDDSERTLATILITNNFINVTIIMLLNYFFSQIVDFGTAYWLHFLVVTVLLTFLLLLFGEIIPKVYSRVSPLAFCRRVVNGILFFRQLLWPIGTLL